MPKAPRRPPGPEPEALKLEGDWEQAVQKGLKRSPPPKKKGKK